MNHWTLPRYGLVIRLVLAMTLAVEPLFPLRQAAALVPMTYRGLITWLSKHKDMFTARYKRVGEGSRQERLLSASEIKQIRALVVRAK